VFKRLAFPLLIVLQFLTTMGMQPHQQGSEAVEMAVYKKEIEYLKKDQDRLLKALENQKAKNIYQFKKHENDLLELKIKYSFEIAGACVVGLVIGGALVAAYLGWTQDEKQITHNNIYNGNVVN
jgi:cytochrome c-type biogenesis protein CcmH/NrfG